MSIPGRVEPTRTRSERAFGHADSLEHATRHAEGDGVVGVDVLALARVCVVPRLDDVKGSEARIKGVALHDVAPGPTRRELRSCGTSSRELGA